MQGSFSDYLEAQILNQLFGGIPYSQPNILYFGYMVGTASDAGPGAEPNSGNYQRIGITNNSTNFPVTNNQIKINNTEIQFAEATANHGLIQAIGIWDSPVSGNMLLFFPLANPVNITVGDAMRIPSGSTTVQFAAGGLSNYVKNAILNQLLGNIPFNIIPTLYFAYSISAPTDAVPGNEPSGNAYGRTAIPNTSNNFPITTNGIKTTAVDVYFAESTGSQGTATYVQVFDASAGGNYLANYAMPTTQLISPGTIPFIPAGGITVTLN